jgi:hypothetical protein
MLHKLFLVSQKYLDTLSVRRKKKKRLVRDLYKEAVALRAGQQLPRIPLAKPVHLSHSPQHTPTIPRATKKRKLDFSAYRPSEETIYEASVEEARKSSSDSDDEELNVELPELEKKEIETFTNKNFGDIAGVYLAPYLHTPRATDTIFGLYRDRDGNFKIGHSQVEIQNNDLYIEDKYFKGTRGLWELLTKKSVDLSKVTSLDKQVYKQILVLTNAHLKNNEPFNQIKANRGKKYKDIIAKLFPSKAIEAKHQHWASYK